MTPSDHFDEGRDRHGESKATEPSFHGWLLDRSKTDLPNYSGQEKLTRLARRWSWLGLILGLGALVCGGLAIGAGMFLGGGAVTSSKRSVLLVLAGFASMLVGILAFLAPWSIVRRSTQGARG